MTDHLNEQLSAYLDGDLPEGERGYVESHLAACELCRADLDGLRRVVRRAASLDDRPPERDLWAGIARSIATPSTSDVVPLASRRRRVSFTVPQLAAAALTLMALSNGVAAAFLHPSGTRAANDSAVQNPAVTTVRTVASPGTPADQIASSYASAIGELQQSLDSRRGRLDTATVRVVEQSLKIIDQAIGQARKALAKDPDNQYLNSHLQRAYDRKLDLLRQ